MKLLITGGSSYLGRHLVPLALPNHEVVYTVYSHHPEGLPPGVRLDLRDETAVFQLASQVRPDVILHLAGSNRSHDMANVIRLGTRHVLHAAEATGARLIHLSTDSVFDGENAPYAETAVPAPINEYGRAKADAEQRVQTYPDHVIIRTSLIYGLKEMDHGTAWMKESLQAGQPVTLFTNQIRNPVWVHTLASACLELVKLPTTGIFHIAGEQALSRAEFGLKMLDYWQVETRTSLTLAPSPPDRWPLNCTMRLDRARAHLTTPLPGVGQVLAQKGQFLT